MTRNGGISDGNGHTKIVAGLRERLWYEQNGHCRICEIIVRMSEIQLDHDHETYWPRDDLCRSCNVTVGRVENGERTSDERVYAYLNFHHELYLSVVGRFVGS